MITLLVLLQVITPSTFTPVESISGYSIPITVVETFQLPNDSDIQDISFNSGNATLAVRSNGAGKIYIVDHYTPHSLLSSLDLPIGSTGFGLAVSENNVFYINSDTSPKIFYTINPVTWGEYENPAGTQGVGMDCYSAGVPMITQLNANPSHLLYAFEPEDSTSASYPFQGVTDEISGYMAHDVMTQSIYPPFTTITTTRFGHEFYFHYLNSSDEYYLYGQEPAPIPVSESLGLTWIVNTDQVYWSYRGTNLEYYISILQIPIFGSIEDDQTGFLSQPHLQIVNNPSSTTASLTVNTIDTVQTKVLVYDVYGRRAELLFDGFLNSGTSSFLFTGPPGVYTAVLQTEGAQREDVRFVLTN